MYREQWWCGEIIKGMYHQLEEDRNTIHLNNFKYIARVVKHFEGSIFEDKALVEHKKTKDNF